MMVVRLSEPHRIVYNLLPPLTYLFMYAVLSGFALVFLYGLYRRIRIYVKGSSPTKLDHIAERVFRTLTNVFAQRKVVKKTYPGLMHILIYSGIIVLFIGTTLVMIDSDLWLPLFHRQILVGYFYLTFKFFLDTFGLVAIAGLAIALFRRVVSKPQNLPSSKDDLFIFSTLIVILLTGYLMEGIQLAVGNPPWAPWSFVGYRVALFITAQGWVGPSLVHFYNGLWWFHALLAFTAVASIPYTKLFHILTSPFNALFLHLRPKGQLSTPFDLRQVMASGSFDVKVGASAVTDFSWQQRLSFDSCTRCGRCTNSCPAFASGTLLSPMHLILKLRDQMITQSRLDGGSAAIADIVNPEELWACTTCRACVNECPVLIDHVDAIVDMRRHLIGEGKLDRPKRDLLNNLNNLANPYGLPQGDRMKWADGLGVKTASEQPEFDILYWVGCAGSYDPRNQAVSKAMVKILQAAHVNFVVLGTEEKCNCETARRLGEEGRFQQGALELMELFNKYKVKEVLTQCPHCFNTFKNEYPEFGATFRVIHHSQFIQELIKSGKLSPKPGSERVVTFHDPCYLGRYNGIFEAPREVASSLGGVKLSEMKRSRENSFCCGAGGANVWYKVEQKKKVSTIRFEEAQGSGANVLATACPFCTSMLQDASLAADAKDSLQVLDIAELVAAQV